MATDAKNTTVTNVEPQQLDRWMREGDAVLIDVREGFEHAAERIPGAEHVPLARVDAEKIRARHPDKRVVFHCRTGKRSLEAARRCGGEAFHLAGGLEAWKAFGGACERSASAPRIDVMRQVQITAGSLVAIGTVLGFFLSPWLLIIPAFVGCGLVFAGATGWCGMAKLLSKMPWNRVASEPGAGAAPATAA